MRWVFATTSVALLLSRNLVPTEGTALGDTVLIAQLWLGLVLLWLLNCAREGLLPARLDRIDLSFWLLAAGYISSGLSIVATTGDKRAALNFTWEWVALVASFYMVRRLFVTRHARGALIAAHLALLVTLSGLGVWQRYVWYPETIAQYDQLRNELDELEAHPAREAARERERQVRMQKLRRDLAIQGVDEHMQSGSGRILFEQRLKSSNEPLGRFALANTFGGALLAWGIVLGFGLAVVGVHWRVAWPKDGIGSIEGVVWGLGMALLLYCLLLTKSRTTVVGMAAAGVLWAARLALQKAVDRKRILRWGGAILLFAVILAGAAMVSGGWDRMVVAEAPKSLRYRWEYWLGTWQIIVRHPIFGAGPGNFRQQYLHFKLPESSEEIADPHNLFLDAWSQGGITALVGLFLVCALVLRRALGIDAPPPPTPTPQREDWLRSTDAIWNTWPKVGAVGGMLAFGGVFLAEGGYGWLLPVLGAVWLVLRWFGTRLSTAIGGHGPVFSIAAAALLIHLLGAGGINMPAIAQILWLMMFLATPGPVPGNAPQRIPLALWGPALLAAGLFLGCFFSTTRPVLAARLQLDLGNLAPNPETRARHYREATRSDPLASEPWQQLASAEFQMWVALGADDDRRFEQAVADQQRGIARDPENFSPYRTLGMFYWQRFQKTHATEDAEQATMAFGAAVSRYPNRSSLQAEWAEALAGAGHPERAKQAALRALDLDVVNHFAGHSDKYLPEDLVQRMERLARK